MTAQIWQHSSLQWKVRGNMRKGGDIMQYKKCRYELYAIQGVLILWITLILQLTETLDIFFY